MRTGILVLGGAVLALLPSDVRAGDAATRACGDPHLLLQRLEPAKPSSEGERDLWTPLGLRSPRELLAGVPVAERSWGNATKQLQTTYGDLTEETAERFLEALLLAYPSSEHESVTEARRTCALSRLAAVAVTAKGAVLVTATMVDAAGAEQAPALFTALKTAFLSAPEPARAAIALARGGRQLFHVQAWSLVWAVSRDRAQLRAALDVLGYEERGVDEMLLFLAASLEPAPEFKEQRIVEPVIRAALHAELHPIALSILGRAPSEVRSALMAGRWAPLAPELSVTNIGRMSVQREPRDIRAELAATLFAQGNLVDAKTWLLALRAAPLAPDSCVDERGAEFLGSLLLGEPRPAPFEAMQMLARCNGLSRFPWSAVVAPLISAQYPAQARRLFPSAPERQEIEGSPRQDDDLSYLAPAIEEVAAARRLARQWLEAAAAKISKAEQRAELPSPDPAVEVISRLLSHPPPSRFRETPLPRSSRTGGWTAAPLADPLGGPRGDQGKGLAPPEEFWGVRAEQRGPRVVMLAASRAYDPTHATAGGYWLLESNDGGRRWSRLYLGLRHLRPYELAQRFKIPMVSGAEVRLEARVREINEANASFPPVGARFKREGPPLLLIAKRADLVKDSDRDGLTDLEEERLFTDPKNPDSDGDQIRDGADAVPQIRSKGRFDSKGALYSAAFSALSREGRTLALEAASGAGVSGQDSIGRSEPKLPLGILLLVASRAELVGLDVPIRTIVLSDEELAQANKNLGRLDPFRLEIIVSPEGDKALIDWTEGPTGGSYSAELRDGKWKLTRTGSWAL